MGDKVRKRLTDSVLCSSCNTAVRKNSTSNVHEKMTYIHGMVLIMMIVSESDKLKKFVTKIKNQSQL